MLTQLPQTMALCLTLTIIIESCVAAVCGVRHRTDFLCVALVNIVTNPLLVSLVYMTTYLAGGKAGFALELALEIAVVAAEGALYKGTLIYRKINPFLLSLILNGVSYASGYIIQVVIS